MDFVGGFQRSTHFNQNNITREIKPAAPLPLASLVRCSLLPQQRNEKAHLSFHVDKSRLAPEGT